MKKQSNFEFVMMILVVVSFCALDSVAASDLVHTTDTLSQARHGLAATTVNHKAFFAGGYIGPGSNYSNVVDIYDADTGMWSNTTLSQARERLAATTVANKAIFAGGYYAFSGGYSSVVDIYDADTGMWSTTTLSQAREYLAATTVASKAIFAGGWNGSPTNAIDIYDANLGEPNDPSTWTTTTLSQARHDLAATTAGNKAIFAGGRTCGAGGSCASNVVDIYDLETGLWSTTTLSQPREGLASTTVGNKAFFAGGNNIGGPNNVVDIYDVNTGEWSTAFLSQARLILAATTVGNKAFFAGGWNGSPTNAVDVYDANLGEPNDPNTWSTTTLSQARASLCATAVANKAMFAGGIYGSEMYSNVVDIFTLCEYELAGDLNKDCKVDFNDFATMANNWLIDCGVTPYNPACIPK